MRKSRFSGEQIIGVLKEVESGLAVGEVCRKHGICDQTYYRWKALYGGLDVNEARRLRQLEDENRRLKQMAADQALDIHALRTVLAKKVATPAARREVVGEMRVAHPELSKRRACGLAGLGRSSFRYQPRKAEESGLTERLKQLVSCPSDS